MKYQAVIFDLFGTLINSFSTREYEQLISEMASVLRAPRDEFVRLWRDAYDDRAVGRFATTEACTEHVCRELGLRPEPQQIAVASGMRLDLTRRAMVPRDGAAETLASLKSRGYKLGLISDCSVEVPALWAITPFGSLIDVPIFSCAVGLKKPDPRIYLLACERLGVSPRECVYVGDGGSRELSGAAALGMRPVLIHLPGDGVLDAHRVDAEGWDGDCISEVKGILELLGECD